MGHSRQTSFGTQGTFGWEWKAYHNAFFLTRSNSDLLFVFTVEHPFLIAVRDNIIYGISLNPEEKTNDAMVPVAGVQNGVDVDFDDSEQMIYWVENPVS